jgi:hypothetical protein
MAACRYFAWFAEPLTEIESALGLRRGVADRLRRVIGSTLD